MSSQGTQSSIGLPQLEIRYTDLSISVQVSESAAARGLSTLSGNLRDAVTALPRCIARGVGGGGGGVASGGAPASRTVKVLDSVSGVLRAGTLTLVLGHPGAGKSSLLKALTARLSDARALRGSVTYNGRTRAALQAEGTQLGQLAQYVSQLDEHYPYLTVRETLSFVARNAIAGGGGAAAVRARVDEVMDLLHLHKCADTIIGDELNRGVSGGEKKRVTVGEGIITAARFLALDEISTGLDSAVTYDVVRALRARAREQGLVVAIALLQPTPEVFALFDDVILMREGAVVYHGARDALRGYCAGLGFRVPTADAGEAGAEDMADWLAEMITFPARRHAKDVARDLAEGKLAKVDSQVSRARGGEGRGGERASGASAEKAR
jgi:ABC-type multidrug transport system ATPase subunit